MAASRPARKPVRSRTKWAASGGPSSRRNSSTRLTGRPVRRARAAHREAARGSGSAPNGAAHLRPHHADTSGRQPEVAGHARAEGEGRGRGGAQHQTAVLVDPGPGGRGLEAGRRAHGQRHVPSTTRSQVEKARSGSPSCTSAQATAGEVSTSKLAPSGSTSMARARAARSANSRSSAATTARGAPA